MHGPVSHLALSAFTCTTSVAAATFITISDPPRENFMVDVGSFTAFATGGDPWKPAGGLYLASGTTDATDGMTINMSLEAAASPWMPQLIYGRASNVWQECLDRIEVNAALKVANFHPTDTRTAADIATAYGATWNAINSEMRFNGASKFVVLCGVDLPGVGVWADNGATIITFASRMHHIRVSNGSAVYGCDNIVQGLGDGSEWASSNTGLNTDSINVDNDPNNRVYLRDIVVCGQSKDTFKFNGGKCHIQNAYVSCPVLGGTLKQTCNPLTTYNSGDRVYANDGGLTTSGPRCFWIKQDGVLGSSVPTTWASGYEDANLIAIDQHADGCQILGTTTEVSITGCVFEYDEALRLGSAYTNPESVISGLNSPLYNNVSTGPVRFQGIRINNSPNKWIDTNAGAVVELSHIEYNSTANTDIHASSTVTHREIYSVNAGVPTLVNPSGSTLDPLLPTVDFALMTADVTPPIVRVQPTCVASGGLWLATCTVPKAGNLRWRVRATLGALTDTTVGRLIGGHVVVPNEASNLKKAFLDGNPGQLPPSAVGEIGNAEGDCQILFMADMSAASVETPRRKNIWDGEAVKTAPFTSYSASVAQQWRRTLPAEPVTFVVLAQSGAGDFTNILDNTRTDWGFDQSKALLDMVDGGVGGRAGLWSQSGQGASDETNQSELTYAQLFGTTRLGAAFTGVTLPRPFTISGSPANSGTWNYIMADACPGMTPWDSGYTTLFRRKSDAHNKVPYDLTIRNDARQHFTVVRSDSIANGKCRVSPESSAYPACDAPQEAGGGGSIGVHFDTAGLRGMARKMKNYLGYEIMRATGLIPQYMPEWNAIWTANYVELWVTIVIDGVETEVPVTTRHRANGGTSNFPLDPVGAPGTPGAAEMLGFNEGDFSPSETVAIIDGITGLPATAGRVRVYPNAGPGTLTGLSELFAGLNGTGLPIFSSSSPYYAWMSATPETAFDHLPVIKPPFPGGSFYTQVLTPVDIQRINSFNTLPAPDLFPVVAGSPKFRSTVNFTSSAAGFTVEATVKRTAGSTIRMIAWPNDAHGYVNVNTGGAIRVRMSPSTVVKFDKTTVASPVPGGTLMKVRVAVSRGDGTNGQVRIWLDDVEHVDANFGNVAFTNTPFSAFATAALMGMLNLSTTSGDVQRLRFWNEYLAPTDTPAGNPLIAVDSVSGSPVVTFGQSF